MKSSVYRNATVVACVLGLLGLLVGCFDVSVSFDEPEKPEKSLLPPEKPQMETTSAVSDSTNKAEYTKETENSAFKYRYSNVKATAEGSLRMSNQTNQPVRLALLNRQSNNKSSSSAKTSSDVPAHWDFAPREGNEKGLILSLPQGNLKLNKGDVLVAFAQDGSRRYWGPYIVGETSIPVWNAQGTEWQLILSE